MVNISACQHPCISIQLKAPKYSLTEHLVWLSTCVRTILTLPLKGKIRFFQHTIECLTLVFHLQQQLPPDHTCNSLSLLNKGMWLLLFQKDFLMSLYVEISMVIPHCNHLLLLLSTMMTDGVFHLWFTGISKFDFCQRDVCLHQQLVYQNYKCSY